ncbi:unnamed protein product [Calypogeia fissa]
MEVEAGSNKITDTRQSEEMKEMQKMEEDKVRSLLQHASSGNVDAVTQILDDGLHVDSADYDGRTALHLAASEGNLGVVQLLLERNAKVDALDRWQDTPLLNAERKQEEYKKVLKLLAQNSPEMGNKGSSNKGKTEELEKLEKIELLEQLKEDYEIDFEELNLQDAPIIDMGYTCYGQTVNKLANWRGTRVAAKSILRKPARPEELQEKLEELLLLQCIRHPNIVEFLGAVTKNTDPIIVTEYLPKGDLHEIIERRGPIPAREAVGYALDIARGMNYLHQHTPKRVIHRDLRPRNLLQDDGGHLKIANFGWSELMEPGRNNEYRYKMGETGTYRYTAPEIRVHARVPENYDTSVDVFSFAITVTEMFEGPQILKLGSTSIPTSRHAQKRAKMDRRPQFRVKTYPPGMKELIMKCWDKNPKVRPTFEVIIGNLEKMLEDLPQRSCWKPRLMLTSAVNNISNKWKTFQCKG